MKSSITKIAMIGALVATSSVVFAKPNTEHSEKMMTSSMSAMHEMHTMELTGNTDFDFITGMIPHHEGAVAMSEEIIPHLKDQEIKKFAQDIVDVQKKEIAYMKEWLKNNPVK